MKPRHGAVSSTLLTVAGALGVGAAALSMLTGVTPCSLVGDCDTDAKAPAAVTVADAEMVKASSCDAAVTACDDGSASPTATLAAGTSGDCAAACDDASKAVAVSDSSCDSAKKADCGATAMTVAAKGDCGDKAAKGACEGEAKMVAASNAASDCGSKSDCGGNAMTVAASNAGCGEKSDCGGKAVAVNASDAACDSDKAACGGAQAMTVAAGGECAAECLEGDAKSLPVSVTAFNSKCPYSGNPVKANVVSAYNGMDVHFCCSGCKMRFENADAADRAKLVARVVEPINSDCCDKPTEASTVSVVQGFPVAFCKSACAEMVRSADEQKQMNFVASKINYVNADCCGKPTADAKLVGFHKGKAVAFNGSGCADKFNAMNETEKDAYVMKVSAGQAESCGDKKCETEGCEAAA